MKEIVFPSLAYQENKIHKDEQAKRTDQKQVARKEVDITWILLHGGPKIGGNVNGCLRPEREIVADNVE